MHKWIPVTGLMCGCQALLCTVVPQQISPGSRSEKHSRNRGRLGKKILDFGQRCQKKKSHEDHGRISVAAEGDLSGLTTFPSPGPTCDLKSGLINLTGIKSLFRRDIYINHSRQRYRYSTSDKWEAENEGKKGGVVREIEWLTSCSQPSAGKGCRCVRRWRGRGWCWRTWSSRSHDPRGTFSGAGIDLKGAWQGHGCQFKQHVTRLTCTATEMEMKVNKLVT